jgi:hypothetical protein
MANTETDATRGRARTRGGQTNAMESCIVACLECHRACLEAVETCLRMGGKHTSAEHVRTLLDCAQSCFTSADFMMRGSEFHPSVCGLCAEICRQCARSCEEVGGDEMKRCAETCRRCADECAAMAQESRSGA